MSGEALNYLTEQEISDLFTELEEDGFVIRDNVDVKLQAIALESEPRQPDSHLHLQLPACNEVDMQGFLEGLFPNDRRAVDKMEFSNLVKAWDIPSRSRGQAKHNLSEDGMPLSTIDRTKAYAALEAPRIIFLTFVIALQFALATWEFVKFMKNEDARHALGWGVIVAKTAAGAIYPTVFFMMLSMSRWLATFARMIPYLRQFVNWDLYRGFHIYMCCSCLVLVTIHAFGHLCGDFVWASRASHQLAVEHLWGANWYDTPYKRFLDLTPGWTGLLAFIIFWTIFGLSLPSVRRRSFELFQLGHLLLFPFVGLLAAHGTLALLQPPMLGYWLLVPTLIVTAERVHRFGRGFIKLPATANVLDKDTVTLTIRRRWGRPWRYSAGQYVLLQVPSISRWQWHPFTISSCDMDRITLHIRTDGNWTKQLRRFANNSSFYVGIDGPFGAPAQQIYHFDRAIVVGSGIGVTPMSSIASDFTRQMQKRKDPWRKLNRPRSPKPFAKIYSPLSSVVSSPSSSLRNSRNPSMTDLVNKDSKKGAIEMGIIDLENANVHEEASSMPELTHRRRIDFHWITRDTSSLKWFSDELNRAQDAAEASSKVNSLVNSAASSVNSLQLPRFPHLESSPSAFSRLDLRVNTYITAPSNSTSTYVLRHLLDRYRSETQSYSALTGLKNSSAFARPNFGNELAKFHAETSKQGWVGGEVGVFFCGNPGLGATLKEACRKQTESARLDGTKTKYLFIGEVF